MTDKDGIEEDCPYCPRCGAVEWEAKLNSEGVDDSITLRTCKDGFHKMEQKVQCFDCETPYTIIWEFYAQVNR